jgi:hypothetical protein
MVAIQTHGSSYSAISKNRAPDDESAIKERNIFTMGKAQRSKNKKAAEQLGNPSAFVENANSGKFLKIAFAVIAVIVAASLLFAALLSSGILLRADYGYKSENFEIDGSMMQYLYHAQIFNFVETYYYYIYYYSLMGIEIVDFSRPLQNQKFSTQAQSLFGKYEGTWFDFFWEKTEAQAKQIIVLCEAAKDAGLYDKYEAEAKKTTEENIKSYKETAKENFSSVGAYFEYLYGEGVKTSDVRKIETLQSIASLYYTDKYEEFKDKTFADKDGINKYYNDNKSDYLMADYVVASFTASLKTNATVQERETFLKEVEEAKKHAEAVAKLESVDAINEYLANYWFDESYDESFKKAFKDAKTEESKIPKDEAYDTIKEIIKNTVLEKSLLKDYDDTKREEPFKEADYKDTYKVLNDLTNSLIKTTRSGIDSINVKGDMHAESTDFDKWLFSEGRKVGDFGTFYGTTESKEDKFDGSKDTSYVVNVIYVTDPVHRDETPSVEFGHILLTKNGEYKTETAQKEKLIALKDQFLKGELTKEKFEELAKDITEDSSVTYDDVCPGDMVTEMDEWLFDEARKAGDVDIVKTADYGYHLVFFIDKNADEPMWFVHAKNDYFADTFEKWYEDLEKSYESTIDINKEIAGKMTSASALLNY